MKRAELRLYGNIETAGEDGGDSITAKGVADALDKHRKDGAKALDVYLSTDGGAVGEGLAIYAQIQRYPGDVTVHVDGRALSIGSVIALAGKRLVMSEGALFMMHDPYAPTIANAAQMRKNADSLDVMATAMRAIYSRKSGLPDEEIRRMMAEETWLTATSAKALRFADEVPVGQSGISRAAAKGMVPGVPDLCLIDLYKNTPANLRTLGVQAALARLEGLLMRQRIQEQARGASAPGMGQPVQAPKER